MKYGTWLLLLLTAALVAVSVRLAIEINSNDKEDINEQTAGMAAYDNIMTRTSIRSYTDQNIPDSIIEKLLRAGMAAPTAANKQPWAFFVINERQYLTVLADTMQYMKMLNEAPLAIVVCGNLDKAMEGSGRDNWILDCSAASENMLLAAHALGLGGVWCGVYPEEERVNTVKCMLDMPDNLIPLNIIAFGYPSSDVSPKDKWNPENIYYNRYDNE